MPNSLSPPRTAAFSYRCFELVLSTSSEVYHPASQHILLPISIFHFFSILVLSYTSLVLCRTFFFLPISRTPLLCSTKCLSFILFFLPISRTPLLCSTKCFSLFFFLLISPTPLLCSAECFTFFFSSDLLYTSPVLCRMFLFTSFYSFDISDTDLCCAGLPKFQELELQLPSVKEPGVYLQRGLLQFVMPYVL